MVFKLLDNVVVFPATKLADPDGLLAVGGDLTVERLLLAYQSGIFPWFSEGEPISWYSPHERCVIFPAEVKISKSMQKLLRSNVFEVTVNTAFERVISCCANTPRIGQDGTWITKAMQKAYLKLHQAGLAHSVEVWQNGNLVGGLYGVKINQVFCGESMFSHASNASKVALIYLCKNMSFNLIDCQMPNNHLLTLGARIIARDDYQTKLQIH
jgi:leucyl/phenylalanyl-tRNA--protein transferase